MKEKIINALLAVVILAMIIALEYVCLYTFLTGEYLF